MRILLLIAALFISAGSMAQSFERKTGNTPDELIFHGTVTFADLQSEAAFNWFATGTSSYKPNAEETTFLKNELGKYRMVVLMGTWCEDSHNMIPRLYKVLQDAAYPAQKVQMYGLDRSKVGKNNEEVTYKVSSVPTVILYDGDKEAGRITELVRKTVEADLVEIIKKYTAR